jgi:hypothetical protein
MNTGGCPLISRAALATISSVLIRRTPRRRRYHGRRHSRVVSVEARYLAGFLAPTTHPAGLRRDRGRGGRRRHGREALARRRGRESGLPAGPSPDVPRPALGSPCSSPGGGGSLACGITYGTYTPIGAPRLGREGVSRRARRSAEPRLPRTEARSPHPASRPPTEPPPSSDHGSKAHEVGARGPAPRRDGVDDRPPDQAGSPVPAAMSVMPVQGRPTLARRAGLKASQYRDASGARRPGHSVSSSAKVIGQGGTIFCHG